jgi:hypothetical protein
MTILRRRREEQGISPGDPPDELVLALEVLAELERTPLALEPDLLLFVRPGMQPLFQKAVVGCHEAVLITDVLEDE